MLVLTSLFTSSSGLFDFDLTFIIEGLLFLFLSFIVTYSFLTPISNQINSRSDFINYNIKKTSLLFTFGNETFNKLISLVTKEEIEMYRQKKILDQNVGIIFKNEITHVQKKANGVLIKLKKNLVVKSAILFSNLEKNIAYLTNEFFYKKFNLN